MEVSSSSREKVFTKIQECSICLNDMIKDLAVSTKCGHIFHRQCLLNSLEMRVHSKRCPNCRETMENTDIQPIIYDLENLKENIEFQDEYKCNLNKMKDQEMTIQVLHSEKLELKNEIDRRENEIKNYQGNFSDIPNLPKINQFPELKPDVNQIWLRLSLSLRKLDDYTNSFEQNEGFSCEAGPFYYADTKSVYQGQFLKQKRHGVGKMIWQDGRFYYGTWVIIFFINLYRKMAKLMVTVYS